MLLLFVSLYFAAFVHVMHSIRLGAFQRIALISLCTTGEQLDDMRKLFDRHIWRVITFRNPWVIYPDSLRGLVVRLA